MQASEAGRTMTTWNRREWLAVARWRLMLPAPGPRRRPHDQVAAAAGASLPLEQFQPVSMLQVRASRVERASISGHRHPHAPQLVRTRGYGPG
jgi:hypothetical protein